jgi:hypothetical protein
MYKLFVFCCLLHYELGRVIDTYDFAAGFGIWHHLCLFYPCSEELRNMPGFLTLYSVSLPADFLLLHKTRIF